MVRRGERPDETVAERQIVSVTAAELRRGSIVWATLQDHRGYRKVRPAIVLTPDSEISDDEPLVLIAVTTTYPTPPPPNHVELPWNADRRRVSTGLARRSAAVVDWLDTAYVDEIEALIGVVPAPVMRQIDDLLRRLERRG